MKKLIYAAQDISIEKTPQYKKLLRRIEALYGPEYGIDESDYPAAAKAWAELAREENPAGAWDQYRLWGATKRRLSDADEDLYDAIVEDNYPECLAEEAIEPWIDEDW